LFSESKLSYDLIQAFSETHYKVYAEYELVLLIGQSNSDLANLHRRFAVDCCAFITACNPYSRALSAERNKIRQQNLATDLLSRQVSFLEGLGVHPSNGWEGEPSFLIFGVTLEDARDMGHALEQNAIVWAGSDATPQLILLR
jgi:hypothetical protein